MAHWRPARSPGHALLPRPHGWTSPPPNVLQRPVGLLSVFDDLDTGNEHDTNGAAPAERALRLPPDLRRQALRRQRQAVLRPARSRGHAGRQGGRSTARSSRCCAWRAASTACACSTAGPRASTSSISQNSGNTTSYTFTYIANDGNLLPAPLLNQFKVRLGLAERADIVMDFARFPLGTELYLVNRLLQTTRAGPATCRRPAPSCSSSWSIAIRRSRT